MLAVGRRLPKPKPFRREFVKLIWKENKKGKREERRIRREREVGGGNDYEGRAAESAAGEMAGCNTDKRRRVRN